jgi:hypothetical protein
VPAHGLHRRRGAGQHQKAATFHVGKSPQKPTDIAMNNIGALVT